MKIIIDLKDKELKYEYNIQNWIYNVTIDIDDFLDFVDKNTSFTITHINEQRLDSFIPEIGSSLLYDIELYIYNNSLDFINEYLKKL